MATPLTPNLPLPRVPSPLRSPQTAASLEPARQGMTSNMREQMGRPELWVYIVITIIVIIVLLYVANDYKCVFEDLKMCSFSSNYIVGALILVVGLLIFAYASFVGQMHAPDHNCKSAIVFLFGAVCVLLVIAFTLFFRNGDYSGAFYVALIVLFLASVHMYFCWKAKRGAAWMSFVWVIVSILFVWFTWDVTSQNNNHDMKRHKKHCK